MSSTTRDRRVEPPGAVPPSSSAPASSASSARPNVGKSRCSTSSSVRSWPSRRRAQTTRKPPLAGQEHRRRQLPSSTRRACTAPADRAGPALTHSCLDGGARGSSGRGRRGAPAHHQRALRGEADAGAGQRWAALPPGDRSPPPPHRHCSGGGKARCCWRSTRSTSCGTGGCSCRSWTAWAKPSARSRRADLGADRRRSRAAARGAVRAPARRPALPERC